MRRWLRRIVVGVLLVVLVAVVAGAGFGVLTVRSSFPQTTGEIAIPGLSSPVSVARDEWGIPHITADTAEDLFLAQGYVHAQDRFWEMDFRRHVTAGRLSELFGDSQVETDAFIRTLGWRRVAEQELELLAPDTIRYLEAYTAGVNAYLETHAGSSLSLEYSVLALQNSGYEPESWTPADSVAWLKAMAWDLSGNEYAEVERVLLASRMSDAQLADLDPPYPYDRHPVIVTDLTDASASRSAAAIAVPPEVDLAGLADRLGPLAELEARLPALLGTRGSSGVGSNSFVVDGSRTTSGMPILANDPHLGPSMPGIWHQVGLHCREVGDACPFDVSGFSFSGFPGIVLGHTDRVAWGFTNLGPDVQDLYLEDVQGDRVRIGDQMVDLDIRTETIEVAGGDPLSIRVRSTRHGPLLSDVSDWYASAGALAPIPGERPDSLAAPDFALQWTASTPGRTADAVFLINQAQDWDDFREAAELFEVPSQNMIYADVDGHIGYQAPGKIPIREAGDGRWPAPGWDSDYDWAGFVDFEEMPWMLDPADGFIATANNAVTDPDYPVYLTSDWSLGDRAARLVELIEGAGPMTVETAMALSFDNHGPIADVLLPALQSLPKPSLPEPVGEFPESPWNALLLFDDWDGQQTADSGGAAVLNAVWRHLLFRTFGDEFADLTQIPPDGGDRWLEMMRTLLEEPGAAWWDDTTTGDVVETRDDILAAAVDDAVVELSGVLGDQPEDWHWGALHTLTLRNASLGESGIAPIEMLFNRGPFETAGGGDVLNATGWYAPDGYEVTWVPSMRMVVDLADLDASRYVNLTGVSGHAFHEHYDDQTPLWAAGDSIAWPFTPTAVEGATVDLLTLQPD